VASYGAKLSVSKAVPWHRTSPLGCHSVGADVRLGGDAGSQRSLEGGKGGEIRKRHTKNRSNQVGGLPSDDSAIADSFVASGIAQTLSSLHSTLEPHSAFHSRRDVKALQKIVAEVEELFGRLPRALSSEVEFDMIMAKLPTKELRLHPFHWEQDRKRYAYDEAYEDLVWEDYEDWV
jgi:hypothetical protein